MLLRNPTLLLLFCGQALYWSCSLIGITLTSLVGVQLAPLNSLATLPLALLVLGNLLAVQPLSHFMQRHGRRPGLMLGAGGGVLGGVVCAAGVWTGDFLWFCLGALGIGVYQASAMYYRFAALEAVDAGRKGRASAYVLAGGVLAALLAPSLARHGLMILIMNATPLAMSFCGLPLEQSSRVIQWHVLGMFLPAFFAGALVDRIGNRRVALLGAFLLAASAGIALGGQSVMHFLLSSLALGSGWNLMLIAGTTLLGEGHAESERGAAQGLMEQGNSLVAALMSFGSGALITSLGWNAVNLLVWPALLVALTLLWPVRRTRTLSR
ncbi:MFS transporter [Pseudomonas aeruginosa]|uniref:MFS transporter n=1 Tax=Pseudomonas aeruginosa TaxID=287 RepID=UPI001EDB6F4B|nr:MFS transporter [Pseudomonas aeruginosa]MCG3074384.1 MFS transporter [Pseudomonas aeruginosa]